ncbi:hypothetical protein J2S74_000479 [Evansella vedderi]|uniref:Uncharacterized protein n=1 Tax=Evansella vedderi TaxID=38282 RepID=A0ABT9ZQV1_9BACI|nr:hypothetical protein [Evansella vedderi]MDQ0253107.1 hypothetical protein [Evansella vedderi]
MNFDITHISDEMPNFQNHVEARKWFKDQYGNRFSLRGTDIIEGKMVHYYHLIKDPEVYQNYMESFAKVEEHEITDPNTFESYSTVEITEDGDISLTL